MFRRFYKKLVSVQFSWEKKFLTHEACNIRERLLFHEYKYHGQCSTE